MNWPTVPLSDVSVSIEYGVTAAASEQEVGPKFLRITDIQDGSVDWDAVPFCEADPRKLSSSRLRKGDIVFARTGATTGKSFLIKTCPENAVFASYLIRVRPSAEVVPSYLAHFFNSADYWNQITLKSAGAAQPGVNSSKLKELKIPLPPLEEQKRIAQILDQADALRRLRTRALDKLDTLGQAIFHEMFVEGADPSWPDFQVEELIANARTGPFGSQLLVSEFVEEGIPVLGIDNVVQNKFVWAKERFISEEKYEVLKRYTVFPGDVLITIMGTCGRCAVVPDNIPTAINTKHICCLTLDRKLIEPKFMQSAFLHHPSVLKQLGVQAKGAVMPGLNMGIIKGLTVQVPPIDLQLEYVRKLNQTTVEISNQNSSLRQIEFLFSSLQHRAFRGEL